MCINMPVVHNLHMTVLGLVEIQLGHAQALASRSSACFFNYLGLSACGCGVHIHQAVFQTTTKKQKQLSNRCDVSSSALSNPSDGRRRPRWRRSRSNRQDPRCNGLRERRRSESGDSSCWTTWKQLGVADLLPVVGDTTDTAPNFPKHRRG